MREKFTPKKSINEVRSDLGYEAQRAHERYKNARERLGSIAVESLTNRKANRLRKVGARMVASSALRDYRKELADDRKERFNEFADVYKNQAKEAKSKIDFAKKGYGRLEKRSLVKARAEEIHKTTRPEADGRGIVGRIGNRLQSRASYKEAKQLARDEILAKELDERAKLDLYRIDRSIAKNLRKRAKQNAKRHSYRQLGVKSDVRTRAERAPIVETGADVMNNERVKAQLARSAAKREQIGATSGKLFGEDEGSTPNFNFGEMAKVKDTEPKPEDAPDTLFDPISLELHEKPDAEVLPFPVRPSVTESDESGTSRKAA